MAVDATRRAGDSWGVVILLVCLEAVGLKTMQAFGTAAAAAAAAAVLLCRCTLPECSS